MGVAFLSPPTRLKVKTFNILHLVQRRFMNQTKTKYFNLTVLDTWGILWVMSTDWTKTDLGVWMQVSG